MEDQQKLNELVNEINAYNQQADLIRQQIELIQASISEVDALSSTLDDLNGEKAVETFQQLYPVVERNMFLIVKIHVTSPFRYLFCRIQKDNLNQKILLKKVTSSDL